MRRVDAVIVGGGQAGLATSRSLSDLGVEHVVLERGRVGERWRSERWDSLRLLTPRWQSRLPGFVYEGPDPDGYMTRAEVIGFLEEYARSFSAPVEHGVPVTRVSRERGVYRVETGRGAWVAPVVVIATGHCQHPAIPDFGRRLRGDVAQWTTTRYRRTGDLPEGGVLVVGASASGVQLAEEIHASGRPVTLAVGRHHRMPRTYRGRDILEWLDAAGVLHEAAESTPDLEASRRQPSLQLVGRPDRMNLDLATLQGMGVRLIGRATDADGARVGLAEDLPDTLAAADAKLERLLDRIDGWIERVAPSTPPSDRPAPVRAPDAPRELDLEAEGIHAVLWATGYRRSYPWLAVPVLREDGEIRHEGGITPAPGLYVLGLPFLRRRNSSWLDGVGRDARFLAAHIAAHLGALAPAAA